MTSTETLESGKDGIFESKLVTYLKNCFKKLESP